MSLWQLYALGVPFRELVHENAMSSWRLICCLRRLFASEELAKIIKVQFSIDV